jgi:hypothetical protein
MKKVKTTKKDLSKSRLLKLKRRELKNPKTTFQKSIEKLLRIPKK